MEFQYFRATQNDTTYLLELIFRCLNWLLGFWCHFVKFVLWVMDHSRYDTFIAHQPDYSNSNWSDKCNFSSASIFWVGHKFVVSNCLSWSSPLLAPIFMAASYNFQKFWSLAFCHHQPARKWHRVSTFGYFANRCVIVRFANNILAAQGVAT